MPAVYKTVAFEKGEFETMFPEIEKRDDLNESDKLRVALGLKARKASAGPPKGNKNALGNKGRWGTSQIGWGAYIDRLVIEIGDEMGISFVDYGEDFILRRVGPWSQDRRDSTFRVFYYFNTEKSVQIQTSQLGFDEDRFKNEVRGCIRKLIAEERGRQSRP